MFVGDQCSWLSWVIYAHEFESPQMHKQAFVQYWLKLTRKSYATHEHWPQQIFDDKKPSYRKQKKETIANKMRSLFYKHDRWL